jgi:quercetin dioxygenase-like cupin family protein
MTGDGMELEAAPVLRRGTAPREGYPGGEIHWLASRKASGAGELTVGFTVIDAGASNPRHRHPNCEEVLYVIAGEIRHHIAGTADVRLTAGDCITIPRDRVHQAFNVGDRPAELLVSFSSAERETIIVTETETPAGTVTSADV